MATLILAVLLLVSTASAVEYYETPHDNVDINTITTEELKALFECLIDRQQCSTDHALIKSLYPEILDTECMKCSSYQKHLIKTLIDRGEKEHNEEYLVYRNKYDPVKYNAYYASLSKY